jgi:hypothetical protein
LHHRDALDVDPEHAVDLARVTAHQVDPVGAVGQGDLEHRVGPLRLLHVDQGVVALVG